MKHSIRKNSRLTRNSDLNISNLVSSGIVANKNAPLHLFKEKLNKTIRKMMWYVGDPGEVASRDSKDWKESRTNAKHFR